MAVTQGEMLQQPPASAQPGQAPNTAANTVPTQRPAPASQPQPSQAQPSQPQQPQQAQPQQPQQPQQTQPRQTQAQPSQAQSSAGGNATQAQAPSPELNFSQVIEQQIAQAIQPILEDFRQNVAQAVDQQIAPVRSPATPASGAGAQLPPAQGQSVQPVQQQSGPATGQQPAGQAQPQQAQQPQQPQQPQQAQPSGPGGQAGAQPAGGDQQGLQVPAPVAGALHPALQAVEHQGMQWIESLLVAGLGALLTESTHAAIQQRAERGLHTLLQKLFEAVPDGVTNQEMQSRTEGMLQTILRESLDAIFAGGMRTTVQQGGQQAIQESLHGDFGGALKRVEDTLKAMADALLTVLRRQWQSVLRLLLALVLLALESSLAHSGTDK